MPGTHQHGSAEGVALAHTIYGSPVATPLGFERGNGDIQPAGLHSTESHLFYTAASRLKATHETSYLTVISNSRDFDSYAKTWDKYTYREPSEEAVRATLKALMTPRQNPTL